MILEPMQMILKTLFKLEFSLLTDKADIKAVKIQVPNENNSNLFKNLIL